MGLVQLDFREILDIIFQIILLEKMAVYGLKRCSLLDRNLSGCLGPEGGGE